MKNAVIRDDAAAVDLAWGTSCAPAASSLGWSTSRLGPAARSRRGSRGAFPQHGRAGTSSDGSLPVARWAMTQTTPAATGAAAGAATGRLQRSRTPLHALTTTDRGHEARLAPVIARAAVSAPGQSGPPVTASA